MPFQPPRPLCQSNRQGFRVGGGGAGGLQGFGRVQPPPHGHRTTAGVVPHERHLRNRTPHAHSTDSRSDCRFGASRPHNWPPEQLAASCRGRRRRDCVHTPPAQPHAAYKTSLSKLDPRQRPLASHQGRGKLLKQPLSAGIKVRRPGLGHLARLVNRAWQRGKCSCWAGALARALVWEGKERWGPP